VVVVVLGVGTGDETVMKLAWSSIKEGNA
jgi:hypothetical protein